jgi:tRNA-2-methylthio-N6-dimethylallyladenosine synthase
VFERFPFVDVAFGPGQVHKLAEFLTSDSLTAQGYFEFEGFTGDLPARRARPFQGWLQISVGCNCACSYCIVPSTRGREVSRPPGSSSRRSGDGRDGVREVTLLGQNVNSYGRDLRPSAGHASRSCSGARRDRGIERIRYTSPHPKDMREDVIRAHAELASVCEHIHLPLQSGSSRILKAMRRTYDRERYLDRVALIREHVPDVALTTDIIVGFPGETEEDFEQTLEVVEQVGYDGAFTFIFSPRRGTEAARSPTGARAAPVKVERMERLLELVQRRARERAQRFVGRTVEVLVEGPSRTDPERLRGRTRHNKVVNFSGLAAPRRADLVEVTARPARRSPARSDHRAVRADRRRQDRGRARAGRAAARARRGPGGRVGRRAAGVRGLEILTGVASPAERARLEHRLVSFLPLDATFSVGQYASSRTRRSTSCSRPAAPDRRRRHRPVPARGAERARPAPAAAAGRARALDRRARAQGAAALHALLARAPRGRPRASTRTTASASCARSSCSTPASSSRPEGAVAAVERGAAPSRRCWSG